MKRPGGVSDLSLSISEATSASFSSSGLCHTTQLPPSSLGRRVEDSLPCGWSLSASLNSKSKSDDWQTSAGSLNRTASVGLSGFCSVGATALTRTQGLRN